LRAARANVVGESGGRARRPGRAKRAWPGAPSGRRHAPRQID